MLGVFDAGQAAIDNTIGTPDGLEAGRAMKLEPEESAWEVELLLSVKRLSWDGRRCDPTSRVSLPRTLLPAGIPLSTAPRAGGGGGQRGAPNLRWVNIRKTSTFGSTAKHQ